MRTGPDKNGTAGKGRKTRSRAGCRPAPVGSQRLSDRLLEGEVASNFFFFILKKSKFQKYMAVSGKCENGPLSPMGRATGLFFKKIYKQVPKQCSAGARWQGAGPIAPTTGDRGPVAPPSGDRSVKHAQVSMHQSERRADYKSHPSQINR